MPHREGFGQDGASGGGGPVAMGGDVTGLSNACVVIALRTYPIEPGAPAVGDFLTWDGAQWAHDPFPFSVSAPLEVRAASAVGVATTLALADHVHRSPVTYLDQTAPDTNVVANRSAQGAATTAGLVGVTNLGVDSTGAAAGATANYATIVGADAASVSGVRASAIGGDSNTASGDGSTVIGGSTSSAVGQYSAVIGAEASSADGYASAIIGGEGNTISGGVAEANAICGGVGNSVDNSIGGAVVGGASCAVSASYSGAFCARTTTVSGASAVALGGINLTVSATYAATVGGQQLTAGHTHAVVTGLGAASRVPMSLTHASGQQAASRGDRQRVSVVVRGDTAGAAPGETVDLGYGGFGASPTTTAVPLLDDRVYAVQLSLVGSRDSGSARALVVHALARCVAGVATIVAQHLVSSVGDASCCLYDVELLAAGATMIVRATTGATNTHVTRWVGDLTWEEVAYL